MGKTRASAAAKKIRFAAKLKNLEFLSENANLKPQPYLLGAIKRRKSFVQLLNQQPAASDQKHSHKERKGKLAHSAGQNPPVTANPSTNNPANKNTTNAPILATTHHLKQREQQSRNEQSKASKQMDVRKDIKAQLTHSEGQNTSDPSSTSGLNFSEPASMIKMNALSPAVMDSVTHDAPQINVQANNSRHQVGNVVMDILVDWNESDTESNRNPVDGSVAHEPPKQMVKTYARSKSARQIEPGTEHYLAANPRQIDLVISDAITCVCGQQGKIDDLMNRNEEQAVQIEKLKHKSEETSRRCLRLTDALNAKILGNPHEDVFSEIEGFAKKEKLKTFSEAGQNSDYVFVKLLMHELWPAGFSNRSVTGRSSNNPFGRNGAHGIRLADKIVSGSTKIPLESNKVSYIEDRLAEHRLYQGDSGAVARVKAKECGRLMTRVIAYYGKKDVISAD